MRCPAFSRSVPEGSGIPPQVRDDVVRLGGCDLTGDLIVGRADRFMRE